MNEKEERAQKALGTLRSYRLGIIFLRPRKGALTFWIYSTSMRGAKMEVLSRLNSNHRKRVWRHIEFKGNKKGDLRARWLGDDRLSTLFV